MPGEIVKDGVTYKIGGVLHLEGVLWMGIPHGYQIVVAELRDPEEMIEFIGADIEGISGRLYFAPEDFIKSESSAA